MQKWQSHKIVEAGKILGIDGVIVLQSISEKTGLQCLSESINAVKLSLKVERGTEEVYVNYEYMDKCNPEIGGYFVKYEDGYLSYSPAKAFEGGYSKFYGEDRNAIIGGGIAKQMADKQQMVETLGRNRRRR